jgi:hypothetical protein
MGLSLTFNLGWAPIETNAHTRFHSQAADDEYIIKDTLP